MDDFYVSNDKRDTKSCSGTHIVIVKLEQTGMERSSYGGNDCIVLPEISRKHIANTNKINNW